MVPAHGTQPSTAKFGSQFGQEIILDKMSQLNVCKSPGPDSFHPRVLYELRYELCEPSQCSMAVRTVVRATQQVNGKWPFSGCQNSVTPELID